VGNERFERIGKSEKALYTLGSPIILAAVALLKDNQTGKVLAQVKFKSVSDKTIAAVFVDVQCKDVIGAALESVKGFQYLDLSAGYNTEFGQKTPIYLPDGRTRITTIVVRKVLFADGTTWEAENGEAWEKLPKAQALSLVLGFVAEQYCRDIGRNTSEDSYAPAQHYDLWFCVCGAVNRDVLANCPHCAIAKETAFSALDKKALHAHKQEYDEHVQSEKEAAAKRARQQQEVDELRRKKLIKQGSIAGGIVAALIVLLMIIGAINKAVKYSSAMKLYEQGNYLEAAQQFERMQDYKDSAALLEKLSFYYPGKTVAFGKDNDKDIEWIVLAVEGEKSLLLSKGIPRTHSAYTGSNASDIYDKTEALFSEFLFTEEERGVILETEIAGNKVHLFNLSIEEAETYFPYSESRLAHGQGDGQGVGYKPWWLRTSSKGFAYVNAYGNIETSVTLYPSSYTISTTYGLRPAMWVQIGHTLNESTSTSEATSTSTIPETITDADTTEIGTTLAEITTSATKPTAATSETSQAPKTAKTVHMTVAIKNFNDVLVSGNVKFLGLTNAESYFHATSETRIINLNCKMKVRPNTTFQLEATFIPQETSSKRIEWASDHPEYVSVSQNGVVTAGSSTSATETKITATLMDGSGLECTYIIAVADF